MLELPNLCYYAGVSVVVTLFFVFLSLSRCVYVGAHYVLVL